MFAAGAARCSPAEGQGRHGVPAGRQYAVLGGPALVPRCCGRVLLFSAKPLLIAPQPLRGLAEVGQRHGWKRYRPMPTRPGKRRLTGLALKYPPPISCECRSRWEYFALGAWYVFVRISFCRVFELSTQELHYGEVSKEKESEEEEVISSFDVSARRNFECDA